MKKFILYLTLVFTATQINAQKSPVFETNGKAIRGYDAVAFFTDSKPMLGQDSLAYQWNETTWLFSSRDHRDMFIANPEKYAPQYGGYCAYGTSEGHKAPTATNTWTVVNDKLYFNYNKNVQQGWMKNQSALIEKANKQWPTIKDKE